MEITKGCNEIIVWMFSSLLYLCVDFKYYSIKFRSRVNLSVIAFYYFVLAKSLLKLSVQKY